MKSDPLTLKDIFEKQRCYLVPLFQRAYVWNKDEQWTPLWDDVRSIADRVLEKIKDQEEGDYKNGIAHFLGTVVLDRVDGRTRDIDARQIVDGQQRLVTLQLLICAARDVCRGLGNIATTHVSALSFLAANVIGDSESDVFKVWPTNPDRDPFRGTMTAGSVTNVAAQFPLKPGVKPGSPSSRGQIPDAYIFFHDQITEWLGPTGAPGLKKRLDALKIAIYNSLVLVVIDLDANDNAQMIFETLNRARDSTFGRRFSQELPASTFQPAEAGHRQALRGLLAAFRQRQLLAREGSPRASVSSTNGCLFAALHDINAQGRYPS